VGTPNEKTMKAGGISRNNFTNQTHEKYIKFEIRIVDSGQGISPENLPKLFMNFSKLEEHAAGNKQGTGLGLSICKTLIEMMGGSVRVESEVGKGTSFIMELQTKCNFQTSRKAHKWYKKYLNITDKGLPQIKKGSLIYQNANSIGHSGNMRPLSLTGTSKILDEPNY